MSTPRVLFFAAVFPIALSGCASRSSEISASYVSPVIYSNHSCNQLRGELLRLNRRVLEVSGAQDKAATRDAWAMGVGMVLFWPALFFITPSDKADELARLKGEYEAIELAAIQNGCDVADEIRIAREQRERQEAERAASADADGYELPGQQHATSTRDSTPPKMATTAQQSVVEPALNDPNRYPVGLKESATTPESALAANQTIGESSHNVETMAHELGCTLNGPAALLANTPPTEIYQQKCSNGEVMIFQCQWRQCSLMR